MAKIITSNAQDMYSYKESWATMGRGVHHNLFVGDPTDCGPHHGLTVVTTSSPALQFPLIVSSWFLLVCNICHGMPMLGVFRSLLLSPLIHNASKSSSTHIFWACKVEFCKYI